MKRFLLTINILFIAITANAQFRNIAARGPANVPVRIPIKIPRNLRAITGPSYSIDTFHYNGETVLMQRYAERDLYASVGSNTRMNVVMSDVSKLQQQLNDMNSYIIDKRSINFFEATAALLNDIKRQGTGFDYSIYEEEYNAYMRINRQQMAAVQDDYQREKAAANKEEEHYREQQLAQHLLDSMAEEIRLRDQEKQDLITAVQEAEERIIFEKNNLKKYGKVNGKAINEGRVLLGMNKEMCLLSWGEPELTNKTTTKTGTTEKWIYTRTQYLIFKNGKVTTINQ